MADSVLFDGSDDDLLFDIGNADIPFGPVTVAMVMKDNSFTEGNFDALLVTEDSGASTRYWNTYMYGFGSNVFMASDGSTDVTGPAAVDIGTLGLTGQWVILVVTKATGTAAPRFHRYDGTNGWDHQDAGSNLTNGTTPPSTGKLRVGRDGVFGSPADINMLIFGIKDAVMSDVEIEALSAGHQAWVDAGFVEGVRLDAVSGLTSFAASGAMTLDSVTGAVVDSGDAPSWWDDTVGGGGGGDTTHNLALLGVGT